MLARTLTALVVGVLFWTAPAGAHDTPDGRACCLAAPALECTVTSSSGACVDRPGVPVPGSLCCSLGEVVDFGCFGASCYTGPDGTAGVGACRSGSWSCSEDDAIICSGEVTPAPETCNGVDDDCDGVTDEGFDADADGFSVCGGDCNDGNPFVNPAAVEVCDGIDNDCDGIIDGSTTDCRSAPNQSATCSSGTCQRTCSPGFGNCNGSPVDGCESNLSSNPFHCGGCNNFCPSGVCAGGQCIVP